MNDKELEDAFNKADTNSDHKITADELANFFQGRTFEIARAHAHASLHERTNEKEAEAIWDMTEVHNNKSTEHDSYVIGGFLTEAFAARGFASRLVNRLVSGDYQMNEDNGNIFVCDRKTGVLLEEKIPGFVRMSLRALYHNALNLDEKQVLLKTLRRMSNRQGKAYDNPHSIKHIRPFIDFHQLNMEESLEELETFKTFNEFFSRKLKPTARPIASPVRTFLFSFLFSVATVSTTITCLLKTGGSQGGCQCR